MKKTVLSLHLSARPKPLPKGVEPVCPFGSIHQLVAMLNVGWCPIEPFISLFLSRHSPRGYHTRTHQIRNPTSYNPHSKMACLRCDVSQHREAVSFLEFNPQRIPTRQLQSNISKSEVIPVGILSPRVTD